MISPASNIWIRRCWVRRWCGLCNDDN